MPSVYHPVQSVFQTLIFFAFFNSDKKLNLTSQQTTAVTSPPKGSNDSLSALVQWLTASSVTLIYTKPRHANIIHKSEILMSQRSIWDGLKSEWEELFTRTMNPLSGLKTKNINHSSSCDSLQMDMLKSIRVIVKATDCNQICESNIRGN